MFVVIGLNQKTPLIYREQIAVNAANLSASICQLQQLPGVNSCTILSTCNRFEIYAYVQNDESLLKWLENHHLNIWPELKNYLYVLHHKDALIHALEVACGIDSMLIGEPQILGQLKQSYQLAIELGSMSEPLKSWFSFIFQMTKKIRSESGISRHPISVASVAIDCIMQHLPQIQDKKALIIGSGDTAKLAALNLKEKGCHQFIIASRHIEHAHQLALILQGQASPITDLEQLLKSADIVITATSCPFPFITHKAMQEAQKQRQNQAMILVDLAVPRDIEANVALIPGITLINIEDLQKIQAHHQSERVKAAEKAKLMVEEAYHHFEKKRKTQKAQHIICDYRSHMKNLAQIEVTRAHQKLNAGHCHYQVLNELSERLIQKLVHYPTIGMQQAASEDRRDLLDLAHYLFNLHRNETVNS